MLLKLARHFYRTKALRTQEMEGVPEEKGMTLRHRCFIEKESLKSRNHEKSSAFLSSKERNLSQNHVFNVRTMVYTTSSLPRLATVVRSRGRPP